MALGSFIGKGFQLTNDNNSKLDWCFFISRLASKENRNFGLKRNGFKLTKNKVKKLLIKKSVSWSFRITRVRLLMQKQSFGHLNLFLALEN